MSLNVESQTEYPGDDDQFEDAVVAKVVPCGKQGWEVTRDDRWSMLVPADSPVEPKEGSALRLYGRGIGYPVRGIFVDGRKVFYRTEAEEVLHYDLVTYGADAADYVRRWDDQGHVWSIEMGGFGPSYEQALQLAMVEVLRHLIATKPDSSGWRGASEVWRAQVDSMHEPLMPVLSPLGLSGAQWGAACSLAGRIYADGPIVVLKNAHDDRKIQVSRDFPTLNPVILKALSQPADLAREG